MLLRSPSRIFWIITCLAVWAAMRPRSCTSIGSPFTVAVNFAGQPVELDLDVGLFAVVLAQAGDHGRFDVGDEGFAVDVLVARDAVDDPHQVRVHACTSGFGRLCSAGLRRRAVAELRPTKRPLMRPGRGPPEADRQVVRSLAARPTGPGGTHPERRNAARTIHSVADRTCLCQYFAADTSRPIFDRELRDGMPHGRLLDDRKSSRRGAEHAERSRRLPSAFSFPGNFLLCELCASA